MSFDNRPIGVFDSGLGGLTVVKALKEQLSGEDIIYLGDTARVPYGSRSKDTILQYALEDAWFLIQRQVKCIVIACNTVASMALPTLQKKWPDQLFISVVEAGVVAVLQQKDLERFLLLGTHATVNSDRYRAMIHEKAPQISFYAQACPLFVPLVEEGMQDHAVSLTIAKEYVSKYAEINPQLCLLGCTHYPLLKNTIKKVLPENTKVIDSAEASAKFIYQKLYETNQLASKGVEGRKQFFVTDMPFSFFQIANHFIGTEIESVEKVQLEMIL